MANFYFPLAFLILAVVCSVVPDDQVELSVELIDDISSYVAEYPESEVTPFRVEEIPIPPYTKRYVFGKRVKGDRVVDNRKNNFNYPIMRDVRLGFHVETVGNISFVEINVKQSSDVGRAYIIAGGIGHRDIKFVVEAKDVYHFSSNTTIMAIKLNNN